MNSLPKLGQIRFIAVKDLLMYADMFDITNPSFIGWIPAANENVYELSNFILGATFVTISGIIYRKMHSKKGAIIGSVIGAAVMAVISLFSNYYIVYPVYTAFMPMEAIIGAYKVIFSKVNTLWDCLLVFNVPFTFFKGLCSVAITFLIYKPLSPILKGNM